MKTLLILLFISLTLQAQEYEKPEFYSLGLLPEGYSFVCINQEKWLQYEEKDKVILEKLYYEDDETKEVLPYKCN